MSSPPSIPAAGQATTAAKDKAPATAPPSTPATQPSTAPVASLAAKYLEKVRERNIEKARLEAVESELRKKRLEVEEQRAKLESLKAESDDKDRQCREEIRRKIAVDAMMEEGYKLYDQRLRMRKVMETINLFHQLDRVKAKRDTEFISELEQEIAGIDADILTEAQIELEKRKMRVLARREGVSTGKAADPQNSEDSQHSSNVIDLTTTSQDSQS